MSSDLSSTGPKNVSDLLARTIKNVAEGFTGIASSDKKEWFRSFGHILQRVRGGKFLSTLKTEWDRYKEKGRISDGFERSEDNLDCLQELLDFIDKDIPDSRQFEAMKNLYLNIVVHSASDVRAINSQQLMRVCRTLSSGELIVLLTAYRLGSQKTRQEWGQQSARSWLDNMAKESGLYLGLVELHEEHLIEKKLLLSRTLPDRSGAPLGQHFRLTDTGIALCEWIAQPPSYTPDS
jgi:hypothetical protein